MLQGIGGLQVFLLLAPEQGREGAHGLLVQEQVALGVDPGLQALLKEDVEGVEEVGLDLIDVRDQAPDAAKEGIGLQGIDLAGNVLGRGAAEKVVADLQMIPVPPGPPYRVEDLFAQGDGSRVGGEVVFRIPLGVMVEQPAQPIRAGPPAAGAAGKSSAAFRVSVI